MSGKDEIESGFLFEIILFGKNYNIYSLGNLFYDLLIDENLMNLTL